MTFHHVTVLQQEVIEALAPTDSEPSGLFVDCTFGGGGHSRALLERLPQAAVIGIDRDPAALAAASERLAGFNFRAVRGNFLDLNQLLQSLSITSASVNGFIYDLGVSSHQIDTAERGFSFLHDGPLDMRMDPDHPCSAADIIAEADEAELTRIFREYGEERHSLLAARKIVEERQKQPIETTAALAGLIERVIGRWYRNEKIHPATRIFQALRIAVNGELDALERSLLDAIDWLAPGGRLAVITFHSLEDRIVKHLFRREAATCVCPPEMPRCMCQHQPPIRIITRRPIIATDEEISRNSRSRSAKLRVVEKLPQAMLQ